VTNSNPTINIMAELFTVTTVLNGKIYKLLKICFEVVLFESAALKE
jgi:hypothetical protein